jgi:carbon monoxide dehydrogenase subunit G
MKITGSATVAAPPAEVYQALNDPAVLVRTIPGCQKLAEVGPDTYAMTVTAGVAAIKGTYLGEVALSDPRPPESFVLRAKGAGAPGTVDATVTVRLAAGDTGTTVTYDAEAVVGGMVGGVGQRMIGSVARKTAGEFFAAVERAINEPAPAETVEERPVYTAPAPAARPRIAFTPSAVGLGAAAALAGVVLGFVLGRI